VLTCLYEKPMHPYEISQTLRARGKQESIRINFGSLYGVVASLERRRLIRAVETVREGKRPERTVYDITEAGRTEMIEWLAELLSVPVKEYVQFEAALSLLPAIPPDEAVPLLRMRCEALELHLDRADAMHEAMEKRGLPRLFALESEYVAALTQAELEFTRRLVADIEAEDLPGLDMWRSWHEAAPGQEGQDGQEDQDETGDPR
jgi:DNA-binding PadR family transcriptional regulator